MTGAVLCPGCGAALQIKAGSHKRSPFFLIALVAVLFISEAAAFVLKRFYPEMLDAVRRNIYFKAAGMFIAAAAIGIAIWSAIKASRQQSLEMMPPDPPAPVSPVIQGDGFKVTLPAGRSLKEKLNEKLNRSLDIGAFGRLFGLGAVLIVIILAVSAIRTLLRSETFDPGLLAAPVGLIIFFSVWGAIAYRFRERNGSFLAGFLVALILTAIFIVFTMRWSSIRTSEKLRSDLQREFKKAETGWIADLNRCAKAGEEIASFDYYYLYKLPQVCCPGLKPAVSEIRTLPDFGRPGGATTTIYRCIN